MAGLKPEGSTQGVKGRDLLRGQGIGKTVTQWCAQCRWCHGDRCSYRKEALTEEIKLWDKAADEAFLASPQSARIRATLAKHARLDQIQRDQQLIGGKKELVEQETDRVFRAITGN